jgi:YbgC/YbaW family acyl-CoA thioester hydrolase
MRTDVEGRLRFRLTFADMDLIQFFFADYYRWMERAFAELMAECDYPRAESYAGGFGFPVVESGCKYVERALIDEQLEIAARFVEMSDRSFRVGYEFTRLDGGPVATGFTQHVCVDVAAMKARPVPEKFRKGGIQGDD